MAIEETTMDQRLSEFTQARQAVIEAIDHFPDDRVDEILFGEWSLKDVLAHLTGWDQYFVEILRLLRSGKEAPHWGSIAKFNQASVQRRAADGWIEVYDEFIAGGEAFINAYGGLATNEANARFWEGKSYTPNRIIEVNAHHYGKSHLPQIKRRLVSLHSWSSDRKTR
ncbi:MAG: ClbS/DfsB family four-helix bundle protein [Anaerolineales bacterium]